MGSIINVVGNAHQPRWEDEGWTIPAEVSELLKLYSDFHPDVLQLIESIEPAALFKWGLRDREPLQQWTIGRVSMLGDAAHPMLPFLGQGAVMAIEDAMVLGRCFAKACTPQRARCKASIQSPIRVATPRISGCSSTTQPLCRSASRPTPALIIERRLPERAEPGPTAEVFLTELGMLAMTDGRERTEAEFAMLLANAGFKHQRTLATSCPLSVFEALPSWPSAFHSLFSGR
jgi:2-polyprenyl-6-methoxyphenol hydroxylase-like FAD-dependent oxidoreductase